MLDIRRATMDDLDALVQLRLDLLREVGNLTGDAHTAELAEATRTYLAAKLPTGEFAAWVAEVDGLLVATSGLMLYERPPTAGNPSGIEAYVMNMYTVPEWRGKGVAPALLREIISFVRDSGARRIWLRATEAGKSIYVKAGFVPTASYMELVI